VRHSPRRTRDAARGRHQGSSTAGVLSPSRSDIFSAAERAAVSGDADALAALLARHPDLRHHPAFADADARSIVAAFHHFDDWPAFDAYAAALKQPDSEIAAFEAAVDAIVAGDLNRVLRILHGRPHLVHVRSVRRHRATLLTYVGANGVEDFRQQTPANIVEVAELLIRSGADVNAVADLYGGSTTLGLAATSVHPERAGVQRALLDALLAHGAAFEAAVAPGYTGGLVVNACLANGRGDAAVHLASRGAAIDLEGACGIGRLDAVRQFVDAAGVLAGAATDAQLRSGFQWACEYGRRSVVEFLLRLPIDLRPKHRGVTGLHWAAHGAHTAVVQLLVDAGSSVDVPDDRWDGTPLDWALHGWQDPPPDAVTDQYYATVALLRSRGAQAAVSWIANPRVLADARMQHALQK
jgi:hypothetical protein